jgi:hypothetical protein
MWGCLGPGELSSMQKHGLEQGVPVESTGPENV